MQENDSLALISMPCNVNVSDDSHFVSNRLRTSTNILTEQSDLHTHTYSESTMYPHTNGIYALGR